MSKKTKKRNIMNEKNTQKSIADYINEQEIDSCYVLHIDRFEEEYHELLRHFKHYYPKTNIAYSFKTNYVPKIVSKVKELGGYAEVVSEMEMELALKSGFNYDQIFFNGPYKQKEKALYFLKEGGTVNIDNISEFKYYYNAAQERQININLGLRLNFEIEEMPSRFGIGINSSEILEILRSCNNSKFITLVSLHFHYAPRNIIKYKLCIPHLIRFIQTNSELLNDVKFLSLGGGFFGQMSQYIQNQITNCDDSTFEEYAIHTIKKLIQEGIIHKNSKGLKSPTILIEPGTAVVTKAFDFWCKVDSIKKISGRHIINTSGSKFNINPSPNRINNEYKVINTNNSTIEVKKGIIVGYTCIESDILHNDFIGKIAINDFICFKEIGSYSIVMKPPFIRPNCPIIMYKNGEILEIKKGESFDDIFNLYMI